MKQLCTRCNSIRLVIVALALIIGLWAAKLAVTAPHAHAVAERGVAGTVTDDHGQPLGDARLNLFVDGKEAPVATALSQADGTYLLVLPDVGPVASVRVEVSRPHFETAVWSPDPQQLKILLEPDSFLIANIRLERRLTLSFWIATLAFISMLAIVATERLHNTLAVLLAAALVLTISLVGGMLNPDLFVFSFQQALGFIDFEVIFLLLGMMIVIGVIEETGIFQWLAYQAYRVSRRRVWLLAIILMLVTFVTSALLDNAVTMLLVTPITLEIALVLGINPLSLVLPAVLSANVGGMATLVGTPVNIVIGSYAGLGFNSFLAHLSPATLLVEAGLIGYVLFVYRREHRAARPKPSPRLLRQLEQDSRIKDAAKLRKAGITFAGLLLLFIFGEPLHLSPPVAAIAGAVVMLIWVNRDIEQLMGAVDWTTLVFFMGLYMMIGAVQEVGLLAYAADGIGALVGNNGLAAMLATVWIAAILSGVVDNVPFAAAMLPVVGFLSRSIPAASPVLFYALAVGANLGGNATLIGSSANLVVKGIAERAGFSIGFSDFLKIGLPATLITTTLGCVWLLVHFR